MTTQPARETAPPQPLWQVQAVFDPEGEGKDFAYTIGLHEKGFPELHIWARPSLGEDPGADWKFSTRDCCRVLNELAQRFLDGRLDVGTELSREYDDGLAKVTFRVDPPGDREQLEAYGVPPGVDVLPVLWSLERPPEGPPLPLTAEAEEDARTTYRCLLDGLNHNKRAPRGWSLPASDSVAADQRFGPLTPVVLARAGQLWQADEETMRNILHAASVVGTGHALSAPIVLATAAARCVGRRAALESLHDAVHDLVHHITERPAAQRRWRRIVAGVYPDIWRELRGRERAHAQRNFAGMLHDVVAGCLMVEAVADVADELLLLQGRGPFLKGLRHDNVLSLPEWRAAPAVLDTVRDLLGPLDARGLAIVATMHRIARTRGITESPGYDELCTRLESWATVSAGSCPWDPVLAKLPGWLPLLTGIPGAVIAPMPDLEHWATCVASMLVHRGRLSADEVAGFAAPYSVDVPELAAVLNRPL